MKKFLLFLTLLVSAIGLTHAEVKTISSNFAKKDLTVGKGELGWTASIEANSFESDSPSRGVQFGAAKGKFTMTSANEISNFKKISLVISSNATDNEITSITVGGTEILSSTPQGIAKTNNKTVEYQYKGDTNISGTIVISFNDKSKSIYVKSITVTYDDTTSGGEVSKDCGITWKQGETILAEGATVKAFLGSDNTLPTLSNTNKVEITYSSSDENVASIAADGTIKIKAVGTTTINASFAGNDKYDPKEVTFTLTVKEAQVAYLVTDASTLQPGDIIVIANQTSAKAISNEANTNNRKVTAVTFNDDFSEITSIPKNAMLIELTQTDTFWSFKTTNYVGTNGFFTTNGSSTSDKNYLKITTTESNYTLATISITDGVASIKFNPGSTTEGERNILKYNSTSTLFSCYSGGQEPVYIYKVVDKPATVGTQVSDFTFATKGEKENFNVIELENMFETSTTAEKVAIYLDNVLVGTFPVKASGAVEAKFDYIPYLPTAKFTMRPVLKEEGGVPTQVGPAEALEFTWPALDDENSFTYGLDDEKIFCVNEDSAEGPWILYGQFFFVNLFEKDNLDYGVSVKAVNNADPSQEYTDAEFAWGNGGFYVTIPNFFTTSAWDSASGRPNITGCTVPVVKFIATPSYEFTYDAKYSQLVTAPTGAPARLKVPGTTATQTITCTPQEIAISTLSATTAVSGVEGVTVDGGAAVEYFNLQGVRVDGDLAPGIYIRRQGQSVSKVQIR